MTRTLQPAKLPVKRNEVAVHANYIVAVSWALGIEQRVQRSGLMADPSDASSLLRSVATRQ